MLTDRASIRRVLRRMLLAVVLVGLVPALAAGAQSGDGFVFEGAGWGHVSA